jgi:acyl-CoA ligase (AMP-forming) (exosortase A-associated)
VKVLIHHLIESQARLRGDSPALVYKDRVLSYDVLWESVVSVARGLLDLELGPRDRLAVYLEKRIETVVALFAASVADGVFVPVNPLLKARQVAYILRDSETRILVTSRQRLASLAPELGVCTDLHSIIVVDDPGQPIDGVDAKVVNWSSLLADVEPTPASRSIDIDMAAILYTSGSTGMPKGVVLSHRNLVSGAESVSQYLNNDADDRILALLPLSFDAGLSQLTTAFNVGATAVLMNFLLARDVVRVCERERITGLTCVPPLWIKIAAEDWPEATGDRLRYFANTGGHMPQPLLMRLRSAFPRADPYLMYGLTEAFRSTYLDPDEIDIRPDSIGKAIPNEEVLVVRDDGVLCAPGEVGELVHRGSLVSMGYWNAPELTAERFKPTPGRQMDISNPEIAVWSGDLVRRDEDGFLYFVGRNDEMIKTSGYRVSPTEVEEVVFRTGLVTEVVALGVPDDELGQAIVVVATPLPDLDLDIDSIDKECRKLLPRYMVPQAILSRDELPRNPNGKIDRPLILRELLSKGRMEAEGTT